MSTPIATLGIVRRIARPISMIAKTWCLGAALVAGSPPIAEAATTITGLGEMATDASGNYNAGDRWNTIGGDSIVTMYVIGSSNFSDPFVNGPSDDANAAVSIPLTAGTYTF